MLFGHKKNETLIDVITWMNLENIRLNEKKNTIPFMGNVQAGKHTETENRLVVAKGWEAWKG